MLQLSRLDDTPILVNLETVKYFEATPDTVIFFTNGDSILVKESLDEIKQRFITLNQEILQNQTK